jgi:hypothetical protein
MQANAPAQHNTHAPSARRCLVGKLLWGVAENYRSEDVFLRAREIVKGIGKVIKADLIAGVCTSRPVARLTEPYVLPSQNDEVGEALPPQ